jgi:chromodomain-helicase-DNA-binding protein 7
VVKFNVMVTSYEVVIQDIEELSKLPWQFLIVDEGHRLKNKSAKLLDVCSRHLPFVFILML